jgi:hypothetical protein
MTAFAAFQPDVAFGQRTESGEVAHTRSDRSREIR